MIKILAMLFIFSNCFADSFAPKRKSLVNKLKDEIVYSGFESLSHEVVQSLLNTKREMFVPLHKQTYAYENRPLAIGYGQTISQPYIVALMTNILNLQQSDTVLEIIPELGEQARLRLKKIGYKNVTVVTGDGYYGLKDKSPFDAIIVTAAATHIPPSLVKQLKVGGLMVIPVGGRYAVQNLLLVQKKKEGVFTRSILPVRFVPLTGKH